MALDPNIALGVRPIEQPNMLGQIGQVMALKAAQQEYEGNEGVRNALSSGVKDPYELMKYGKQGRATAESLLKVKRDERETQKLESEILGKTFENSKYALSMVNSPESLRAYTVSQFNDPVMGSMLKARGLTPEVALTNLDAEIAKNGFANTYKKSAMGLDSFYKDETLRATNAATVGASYYSSNVNRDNSIRTDERERAKRSLVTMDNGYGTVGFNGGIRQVTGYENDQPAPLPAAAASNFVTPQARNPNAFNQKPSVNSLTSQSVNQADPTVANAAVVQQQQNVPRPPMTAVQQKERGIVEKLPEAIAMNKSAIQKIDQMIGGIDAEGKPLEGATGQPHPGLSKATGFGGGAMRFFAGTEGKNFEVRHKEVLSQAFLDAFEALKGGGAITEKEGEKATSARTRMDLAQSKEEYIDAAREYQDVLRRGIATAEQKFQRSGGGTSAKPSAAAASSSGSNIAPPKGFKID